MRKCDWCIKNSFCLGVARSECIVRDYRDFVQVEQTDELIQELSHHARHSKDGKMGDECTVPKSLLADAADKLEKFLNGATKQ